MVLISAYLEDCTKAIKCFETLFGFSTLCQFTFTPAGMSIQCVPPAGLSCCDVAISKALFLEYSFDVRMPAQLLLDSAAAAALVDVEEATATNVYSAPAAAPLAPSTSSSSSSSMSFKVSIDKFQELLRDKNDKNNKNTSLHFRCIQPSELRINVIVRESKVAAAAAAAAAASDTAAATNRPQKQSPYEMMMETAVAAIRGGGEEDEEEDCAAARIGSSSSKRRRVSAAAAPQRHPAAAVQRAILAQNEALLRANDASTRLNAYFTLPRVVTDFDFRVWIDAVELSTIFREVSIPGNVLRITADSQSSELRFHSSGELGDIDIRCVCVSQFHSRKDVEITMRNPSSSSVVAAAPPAPFVVSECFSNRCLKFFCSIMTTPNMVCMYVTKGRPLVLSLPMHQRASAANAANSSSSSNNPQVGRSRAAANRRSAAASRRRAAASKAGASSLMVPLASAAAVRVGREEGEDGGGGGSSLPSGDAATATASAPWVSPSVAAATTTDVHISCHIVPHRMTRR